MSELKEIISTLNITEQQKFKRFLNLKNKREDVRNITLLEALFNGGEDTIKKEIGVNAFHVLSKRLKENSLEFIAFQELKKNNYQETIILKEYLSCKRLLFEGKHKIGLKLLRKVEERCLLFEQHTLLTEVLRTHISYGHLETSEELDKIFITYENTIKIALETEKLNLVYAQVKESFLSLDSTRKDFKLEEFIENQFKKYKIDSDLGYTFKTLYTISEIIEISGAHYKNYHSVNLFFADKLAELKGGPKDTLNALNYHIKLLYSIANVYFRKREFMVSLFYLEELERQISRSEESNSVEYKIQIKRLKMLNYNYLGNENKVLQITEYLSNQTLSSKSNINYQLNLTLAILDFQRSNFIAASEKIKLYKRSDSYYEKELGMEWIVNRKILEIILKIELNQLDNLENRIISLRRKYGEYYKNRQEFQFISFLGLIKLYGSNKDILTTEKFQRKVHKTMSWNTKHDEFIFLQSFYAWLKAKVENTNLYETTLQCIK